MNALQSATLRCDWAGRQRSLGNAQLSLSAGRLPLTTACSLAQSREGARGTLHRAPLLLRAPHLPSHPYSISLPVPVHPVCSYGPPLWRPLGPWGPRSLSTEQELLQLELCSQRRPAGVSRGRGGQRGVGWGGQRKVEVSGSKQRWAEQSKASGLTYRRDLSAPVRHGPDSRDPI